MGQAEIISNEGYGLYTARLIFDVSELEKKLAKNIGQYNYYTNKMDTETDEKKQKTIGILLITIASIIQQLEEYIAMFADVEIPAWCVDYSLSIPIGSTVATLEIPGELNPTEGAGINIAPGGTVYDQSIYGRSKHVASQTKWNAFLNIAFLPAWQKFNPLWRYGVITDIDYDADTCSVDLYPARSSAQGIDINQATSMDNVPIVYMTCNAGAFEIGDDVVVKFIDQKWSQPQVIGFKDHPQACNKIWGFVFNDLNYDGIFDPIESGIEGIQIRLLNQTTQAILQFATTDGNGLYEFYGITDGDYTVQEIDPAGFASTTNNLVNTTITGNSSSRVDFGDCIANTPYVVITAGLYVTVFDPVTKTVANVTDPLNSNPIIFPVLQSDAAYQRWYALVISLIKTEPATFSNRWDDDSDYFISRTSGCHLTPVWGPYSSNSYNCPDTCYKQMISFDTSGTEQWPEHANPMGGGSISPLEYTEEQANALKSFFADTGLVLFFENEPGFEDVTAAYTAAWQSGELLPGHFSFGIYFADDPATPYYVYALLIEKCKLSAEFEFYNNMGKLGSNIRSYDIDYNANKSCIRINHVMNQTHQGYGARTDWRYNFITGAHPINFSRSVIDEYDIITPIGVESVTVNRTWSQPTPDTDPTTTTTYSNVGDEKQQYGIAYGGNTILQFYNHYVPVDDTGAQIKSCHATIGYYESTDFSNYNVFAETRNAAFETAIINLIQTAYASWGNIEIEFVTGI